MAPSPYQYQVTKNTTGYPAYLSQPAPKKKNTDSIYAAPLTGSHANQSPQAQPALTQQPAHRDLAVTPGYQTFDYNTDPVLQQIQAVGMKSRGDADAAALGIKKQLAVQYGDPALANQIGDPATADAASKNPYGAFQQLQHSNETNAHNLDENLNAHNLFYGGARINQQRDLADVYGKAVADTTANEQSALSATEQARLSAFLSADQRDAEGQQTAAWNALAFNLAHPPPPPNDTGYPQNTTYAQLGATPGPITPGLVEPPVYPTTPKGLQVPDNPFSQTVLPWPGGKTAAKRVAAPPGALAQALAAGVKSRGY